MTRLDRTVGLVVLAALIAAGGLFWLAERRGLPVVGVAPADGATGVSTRAEIRLSFDQAILNPEMATLTFTPPISATVRWEDDRTLVLAPARPLQPESLYRATLSGELEGERGQRLRRPFSWIFETGRLRVIYLAPDEAGQIQLFAVAQTGGEARLLTDEPLGVVDYAVGPHGRRIAYAAATEEGADLWLIDDEGEERQRVLNCGDNRCQGVAWAPNGGRLVYELHRVGEQSAALWWLDLSSGQTVPVFEEETASGVEPQPSPDAEWLSFVAPETEEVHTVNLESGRRFVVPSGTGETAAWAPDSQSFVVTAIEIEGTREMVRLFRIDVASGQLSNVSGEIIVDDSAPDWSPDGAWIAVARTAPRTPAGRQLVLTRPNGSETRRLTGNVEVQHAAPRWSPDGRSLVYTRFEITAPTESAIWLIDVATGEQRELVRVGWGAGWLP